MPEATVSELERQIRALINDARKQHVLLNNSATWIQISSSLDVIGDTELAFEAYDKAPPTDDAGAIYILVYGVLQALVLQQDAVRHLVEALGLDSELGSEPDSLLLEVREVRNASVGHPTKRRSKRLEPARSHFISRISMTKTGFQLITVYANHDPPQFKGVSLPELIVTQRSQLRTSLNQVVALLQKEEAEHKAMFKDDMIAAAFHPTTDYYFEKIYESIPASKPSEYGRRHVELIVEAVERFKAKLAERGIAGAYDSVKHHLDLVSYPLQELKLYFDRFGPSKLNERDAFIFVHFIQDEINTLRSMAVEIDESYQKQSDA